MELTKERVIELTWKYLRDDLTDNDRVELDSWLADPYNKARFDERIRTENILEGITMMEEGRKEVEEVEWKPEAETTKIVRLGERVPAGKRRMRWMVAAASVVVIGGAAALWNVSKNERPKDIPMPIVSNDLPPGGNKAILTLADGSRVRLDDAKQGTLAKQGNSDVVKEGEGQVTYKKGKEGGAVGYNTITTPRGGEYRVVLPDGSRVWLDAGSSLKFPTEFNGKNREVVLAGQGYFEAFKDPMHPFIVTAGKMQVRVLGTSFNIMAYQDEQTMNTSLITGAIAVVGGRQRVVLQPEQQAQMDGTGGIKVGKVNTDEVLAWKNGVLEFDGADIGSVMRAVTRWWDVDVRYEAGSDSHTFTGQLSKDLNANDALKILTTSGYHFRVDGRIITVLP